VQSVSRTRSSRGRRQRLQEQKSITGLSARELTFGSIAASGIHIEPVMDVDGACEHHPGEWDPEPVYVYIDLDERRMWVSTGSTWYASDFDDPMIVRYRVGSGRVAPTAEAINTAMRSICPDAAAIADGASRTYDNRLELDSDAEHADSCVRAYLSDLELDGYNTVGAWDLESVGEFNPERDYGLTAHSSDDELRAIEARVRDDYGPTTNPEINIRIWHGLWEDLVQARADLATNGRGQ